MAHDFNQMLDRYAEVALEVGLDFQPGQRLLIGDPILNKGVPIEAAPLVRRIVTKAYQRGATLVDVMWSDDQVQLARYQYAPRDSFAEYSTWQGNGMLEHVKRGDPVLIIIAADPDLLAGQDPELVAMAQRIDQQQFHAPNEYVMRNAVKWSVIAAATGAWAAKVLPDVSPESRTGQLWDAIFAMCRVDQAEPVKAWNDHLRMLAARADYLTSKQYMELRYTAPGTDLVVGLPRGHIWKGGRIDTQQGMWFTPNLPTEEVYTLPHKDRTEGVVRASMPLSTSGTLVQNFSLRFHQGRVVDVNADQGESVLRKLIETDEGAGRLGEVALVPQSSPIARSGRLFYNTLIDENATNHIALGGAYPDTLRGGEAMSEAEFTDAGGNKSMTHVDFMIGSTSMDVDGVTDDGIVEPVMRGGEWVFGDGTDLLLR